MMTRAASVKIYESKMCGKRASEIKKPEIFFPESENKYEDLQMKETN